MTEAPKDVRKMKIAFIGISDYYGQKHFEAVNELGDYIEIAGLYDENEHNALRAAKKFSVDSRIVYGDYIEMLDKSGCDAVDVMIPAWKNYNYCLDVLLRGKHLITEKPLSVRSADTYNLVDIAGERGLLILVLENQKYSEENHIIKNIIENREIGNITCFSQSSVVNESNVIFEEKYEPYDREFSEEYHKSNFLSVCVKDLSQMRYMFSSPRSLIASSYVEKPENSRTSSMNLTAKIVFESGVQGKYSYYSNCLGEADKILPGSGIEIFGEDGELYIKNKEDGLITLTRRGGSSETIRFRPDRGYVNEFANFYNAVTGLNHSTSPLSSEIDDIKYATDILQSADRGEIISY